MLNVILWLLLILISLFTVQGDGVSNDKGIMKIDIHRQKTPFEQHLNNAESLMKYGLKFDWLYKKHSKNHHTKGEPRTNDSIALKRYLDNEFYGEIVVGHPGQKLLVAFDTSWSLSWVISSQCKDWEYIGCSFHNKYDHTKSSEYRRNDTPIIVPEGKEVLKGFFSYDNISIAHSNVTNFSFVEMNEIPRSFMFSKIDGVLGLGLQDDTYEPFFYTMLRQKKIKNPVFSVYLNRDKQSNKGGNVMLGYIEQRHIHSKKDKNNNTIYDTITYLPVKAGKFWQFDLDRIYVNDEKDLPLMFCGNGKCNAMTDTSTNNILGPQADVKKIHQAINARPFYLDRYMVNCDTINKLPIIAVTLGGQNFTLKGRDYIVMMSEMGMTRCLSAFVPHDYTDLWVFGGAFLSEYYTIYNIEDKQVGVVKCA